MEIRECRAEDVAMLEKAMPSPGLSRYHEARYRRQAERRSTYLVAWHEVADPCRFLVKRLG
ncbi:hypothetical protein M1L60_35425 [Actinoplanes sp. TRM 88003]|uniref:GNAT family N-acetyltransferase n=1 Tax=Paractinoplanes aksuensis TaxID=2939490 RepID=A0ABT1DYE2_9ACTN|nr:hypothetical protein [Actinoplanes aksuensis]MCO8275883.1 hypothetical protein [Actinoplanes aksuensis]